MIREDQAATGSESPSSAKPLDVTRVSVNVLCLCSVVIGVAAVFCSWIVLVNSETHEVVNSHSIADWIDHLRDNPTTGIGRDGVGMILFIAGVAVSFYTPLGGGVQGIGIVLFLSWYLEWRDSIAGAFHGQVSASLGIGFWLGCISAVFSLLGLIAHFEPGYNLHTSSIRGNLKVFIVQWNRKKKTPGKIGAIPRSLFNGVQRRRGTVAAILMIALLSASVVRLDATYTSLPPPLVSIGNGVMFECRGGSYPVQFSWERSIIQFSDSPSSVHWHLNSSSLNGGTVVVFDNGTRSMGDLVLRLTIIDRLGDGLFGFGDRIMLTTENGSAFAPDHEYNIRFGPLISLKYGAGWGIFITFIIHESKLDSTLVYQSRKYRLYWAMESRGTHQISISHLDEIIYTL